MEVLNQISWQVYLSDHKKWGKKEKDAPYDTHLLSLHEYLEIVSVPDTTEFIGFVVLNTVLVLASAEI